MVFAQSKCDYGTCEQLYKEMQDFRERVDSYTPISCETMDNLLAFINYEMKHVSTDNDYEQRLSRLSRERFEEEDMNGQGAGLHRELG